MEFGTIKFERKNGDEIWKITSSDFSISLNEDKLKVNIWVVSDYEVIKKLEDTGDTSNNIEVVFSIEEMPDLSKKFIFEMPNWEDVKDEHWGEDKDYFFNWYYYQHMDVENLKIEIEKTSEKKFFIKMEGIVEDPMQDGIVKMTIEFQSKLSRKLKGLWAH